MALRRFVIGFEDKMGYSRDDLEIDGPLKTPNRSGSSFAAADLQAERMGGARKTP